MNPLLELAGRVEAATGPDRDLDIEVAGLVGGRTRNGSINISAHYTASLDAAMTLVPNGAVYAMSNIDMPNGGTIGPNFMAVVALTLKEEGAPTTAATQPLALTAASLRARAALDPAPDDA